MQVWDRAGRLQWEEHAASPLPALLIARHPFARIASAFRFCISNALLHNGDGRGDLGDDGNDQNARVVLHREALMIGFRWLARLLS